MEIDVTKELNDLLKVYTESEKHLKEVEASTLETLNFYMKRYLQAKDKVDDVTQKLSVLRSKMSLKGDLPCEEGEEECI